MPFYDLFKKHWAAVTAAITTGATLIGIGYGFGVTKLSDDHKIEIMQINNEWAQRLQDEKDKIRDLKEQQNNEKVANLEKLVAELRERRENEK